MSPTLARLTRKEGKVMNPYIARLLARVRPNDDEATDIWSIMYNAEMQRMYGVCHEDDLVVPRWHHWRWAVTLVVVLHARVWGPITAAVCKRRGHRLVDAGSYANHDSGADHLRCTRCGCEFTHIYY